MLYGNSRFDSAACVCIATNAAEAASSDMIGLCNIRSVVEEVKSKIISPVVEEISFCVSSYSMRYALEPPFVVLSYIAVAPFRAGVFFGCA